jgi:hypothetical protein
MNRNTVDVTEQKSTKIYNSGGFDYDNRKDLLFIETKKWVDHFI